MKSRVDRDIASARTELLYKNARISSLVVLLVISVMASIMHGKVEPVLLLVWYSVFVLLTLLRVALVPWRILQPDSATPAQWANRYGIMTASMGLGWAAFAWLGYGVESHLDLLVLVIVIGMAALAVPALIAFPSMVFVYSGPAAISIAGLLLADESMDKVLIGVAMLAFIAMMIKTTFNFWHVLMQNLSLRFGNEQLNSQLKDEIAEHRATQKELEQYHRNLEDLVELRTIELVRARDDAEAGNRAKSRFLTNISHEIRTPLNAIMGFAYLGRLRAHDEPQRRSFSQIEASGKHLMSVVDDILDISQVESGKLSLKVGAVNLRKIIDTAIWMVSASAETKNLEIQCEIDDQLPDWIEGDAARLQQILNNLLSNAVKFTPEGWVRLHASADDDNIMLDVSDSGIGIDLEQIDRLLKPFEQADTSSTRRYGGTGLGLAISNDLVRLMGGELVIQDLPNNGSLFRVVLPLHIAQPPSLEDRPRLQSAINGSLRGLKILVVEDIDANRKVLQALLADCGAEVRLAVNGQDAVEQILHQEIDWDVVLMDIQMPVMDGYEATRRILSVMPKLPIIALTAHASAEDHERCLAAGMRERLTKPVEQHTLAQMIRQHTADKLGNLSGADQNVSRGIGGS